MTAGDSGGNYMAYGGFDQGSKGTDMVSEKFFPRGYIVGNNLAGVSPVDETKIAESVKYSWYTDACEGLNPKEGKTDPQLGKDGAYSFLKAPRYDGKPMEVGPMARMLVMAAYEVTGKLPAAHHVAHQGGRPGRRGGLGLIAQGKFGILPRHAMRALELQAPGGRDDVWLGRAPAGRENLGQEGPSRRRLTGAGWWKGRAVPSATGSTSRTSKIGNYQAVVPTTWNCSPRDKDGVRGPVETALIGIPVPDVDNPINVGRCVRSFDPCIACAVHVIHPEHNGVKAFRVV